MLRILTWLEGCSYLLLVCVAMPLKYVWELPAATRIAGGIHGVLFLGFLLGLHQMYLEQKWSKRRIFSLLLLSLVPGSLWWLDARIRGA